MKGFGPALDYVRHMRLGFQLLLAPLFLWGLLLGGAALDVTAAVAFLSLHLFLYPGATAYNSAYDRDRGPVSGLARPPRVPPGLLGFALLLQIAGALLAVLVGWGFTLVYAALAAMFAAYSHPATRLKASPVGSALFVFAGQGLLGFAAGWVLAGESPLDGPLLAGAVAAGLTALGLYPSTQIFQVEEDLARGDRTLAVVLGPAGALRLGASCLVAAGASAAWAAAGRFGGVEAAILGSGYLLLALRHGLFARKLAAAALPADHGFRWATGTRVVATAFFLAFLAWLLVGRLQ